MSSGDATQVYRLYINAPREKVWEAITKPEFVAKFFFGARVESSYALDAPIVSWSPDLEQRWTEGTVLEHDPPRRLVHTWRSLYRPELAAEPASRVTYEIDELPGGYSRLTLVHDRLDDSPHTAASVQGWSYVLSNLKTLLETGTTLPPRPD